MSPRIRQATLTIVPPTYDHLRLTIPVREALERAGNEVSLTSTPDGPRYTVTLAGQVPDRLVVVLVGQDTDLDLALRRDDEPEYPGEWTDIAWHTRGDWIPCPAPSCRRALVWYEAGYVPGYRVCTRGHHVRLSDDGRSASVVREP